MIIIVILFNRFIGPFLETVNKWERTLALISEIIDEWLVVQRKWLYLEGIFIGGDIRTQLPEEARKFDDIDKSYRRVSNPKLFPCSGYLVIGLFGCLAPKAAHLVSGYNLFGLI